LPQGGLEESEEPFDAAQREIREETGIRASALQLMARFPELLAYELPPESRSEKTGRGQVHYWFLFRLDGGSEAIDLTKSTEFSAWRWMDFEELAGKTVAFRAPVYRRLAAYFRNHLDPEPQPGAR
jgi:putative (di)nucleoside polyphosphate hydrolase